MKNNGNCGNRIHTGILIDFLVQLKECDELESEFFISDKNFVQISAIHFIWKNIKVQLYLWYIEKAVKPINLTKKKVIFCPKELCSIVWKKINKHLHEHSLISMANGQFRLLNQIWKEAVKEIYDFSLIFEVAEDENLQVCKEIYKRLISTTEK
ncbi:15050_t:CDS:2, partial [Rhizophagus irregularis]